MARPRLPFDQFKSVEGEAIPRASMQFLAKLIDWRLHMLSIFRRLMKHEGGATAIEYTLIASLIAVAAIVAMRTVSESDSRRSSAPSASAG